MTQQIQAAIRSMPLYQCRKKVYARKISKIDHQGKAGSSALGAVVHFEKGQFPLQIDSAAKHQLFPELVMRPDSFYIGNYFVVEENGAASLISAKDFESDYQYVEGSAELSECLNSFVEFQVALRHGITADGFLNLPKSFRRKLLAL